MCSDETINVMTLGGLALAVGILVDDATVMIENIDRHIEMGKPLEQAIIDAANQIVVPTLVATLCIAIVWLPLFELGGVAGYLFKPMAEAVIIAMLASFILSRTLVPTMAKYMLKESPCRSRMSTDGAARRGTVAEPLCPLSEGVRTPLQSVPRGLRCAARTGDRPSWHLRHDLSGHRGGLPRPLFLPRARLLPRDQVGDHVRCICGRRSGRASRCQDALPPWSPTSIEELLPGQVENIVSNCGLPVGPHNLAFIPTPTIGSQDCDLTILLKNEKSPVWDYRRILRKGLTERYPGTEFTFQPSDLTAKILNFGAPAPIDVQINGPDMYPNYEFARKLAGKFREIPGAVDVVIQQTMRTPTLMVEGNRTFGLGVNRTLKDMADNLLMTTAGSQQVDQNLLARSQTGMSYLINVYTPQSQINSINSLMTIPVDPRAIRFRRE